MKIQFPVVITKEEKYYVTLAVNVDISSQGETVEEALENLLEALELYLEDEDSIIPESSEKPILTIIEVSY